MPLQVALAVEDDDHAAGDDVEQAHLREVRARLGKVFEHDRQRQQQHRVHQQHRGAVRIAPDSEREERAGPRQWQQVQQSVREQRFARCGIDEPMRQREQRRMEVGEPALAHDLRQRQIVPALPERPDLVEPRPAPDCKQQRASDERKQQRRDGARVERVVGDGGVRQLAREVLRSRHGVHGLGDGIRRPRRRHALQHVTSSRRAVGTAAPPGSWGVNGRVRGSPAPTTRRRSPRSLRSPAARPGCRRRPACRPSRRATC